MASLTLYTKIETLPTSLKKKAEKFIDKLLNEQREAQGEDVESKKEREFGSLKGKIHLLEDFDSPLDDFNEYM